MDVVEGLRVWTVLSYKKMIVTSMLILAVGSGYIYINHSTSIEWSPPLSVDKQFLVSELTDTPFDYIGVFEYRYVIPFEVIEIQKACVNNTTICYRSKNYYLHQDLYRVKYHMQNLCEIHRFPNGDALFDMKVMGTCPIIVDSKLKGYLMVTSSLNTDSNDMMRYMRETANKIAVK